MEIAPEAEKHGEPWRYPYVHGNGLQTDYRCDLFFDTWRYESLLPLVFYLVRYIYCWTNVLDGCDYLHGHQDASRCALKNSQ